jgi:sulfur relay (sulfurtransferase) complex TusBCD TusD component (DsrE family)
MKSYLLIQSLDPFTTRTAERDYALAQSLHKAGNSVRVLLVQNGVMITREAAASIAFERLVATGIPVFADIYALAERGIDAADVRNGIAVAELDLVVQALLAGDNVIWH